MKLHVKTLTVQDDPPIDHLFSEGGINSHSTAQSIMYLKYTTAESSFRKLLVVDCVLHHCPNASKQKVGALFDEN